MKGEDQQNQHLCWVRNGEMNMQLKERFIDSVNESSCATSPTSRVHTHTRAHAAVAALYPCPEIGTYQEHFHPAAQTPALGSFRKSKTLQGGELGEPGL